MNHLTTAVKLLGRAQVHLDTPHYHLIADFFGEGDRFKLDIEATTKEDRPRQSSVTTANGLMGALLDVLSDVIDDIGDPRFDESE